MKPPFIKSALVFIWIMFYVQSASGQNAPVTSLSAVTNAIPAQQVTIQATVTGFNNIGSVSLSLDYDFSSIQYISTTVNSQLTATGNVALGDNDLGNGMHRLIIGWFISSGSISLADNSVLLAITFNYTSASSSLSWFDNGASCAYTDAAGMFLNDLPSATYYINGRICGAVTAPGPVTGTAVVPPGSSGLVYSIPALTAATGYLWSVPAGAVITAGQNTTSITVDYPSGSLSGNITVSGYNHCGSGPELLYPVTVSVPTGIESPLPGESPGIHKNELLIYPNPASDFITVTMFQEFGDPAGFSLFSGSGTLVRDIAKGSITGPGEFTLETAGLKPGIYYLVVTCKGHKTLHRIIIQ